MNYILLTLLCLSSYLAYKVVKAAKASRRLVKENPLFFKKYSTIKFEHNGKPQMGMVIHQVRETVVIRLNTGETITKHATCCTLI